MRAQWKNRFANQGRSPYLLKMNAEYQEQSTERRFIPSFRSVVVLLMLISFSQIAHAEDFRKVVQLTGYWKFSVGDYEAWSDPNYDDSGWDEIRVPGKWEDQGYQDYNGYAWYRKKFKMYDISASTPIYLYLGRIDDADEVYLNGKLLGRSGSFPPQYITAYNQERKYYIPREYLNFNGVNTIAVRIYDEFREGGIIDNPAGIYVDESYRDLDLIFPGRWKFHLGDNSQWKSPSYDDSSWELINVPSAWEQEGYPGYDGYAWYRLNFSIPAELRNEKLYVVLGKIDDEDHVYLNGHLIGSVFDLPKDGDYRRKGYEYNARRVYAIPADLIRKNGENVLAVRVYDGQIRGGIYEGPLGLMTYESYRSYQRKHQSSQPFIDYLIDILDD